MKKLVESSLQSWTSWNQFRNGPAGLQFLAVYNQSWAVWDNPDPFRPSPSVILVGDGVIVSVHRSLDNRCLMRTLCQSGPERDLIHEAQQNPALDPIRIKLKGTLMESGNFKLKAETSPEFVTDPNNSEPDLNEAGSVCWWIWITCSCCTWVTWINSQKRPF